MNHRWRRPRVRFALALAVVLLLGGCSSDDDAGDATVGPAPAEAPTPPAADGGSGDSDSGDGGSSGGGSSDGLTDTGGFEIPAPAGGDVNSVQTDRSRLVTYPASELDRLIAFYEDWVANGDWQNPEGFTPEVTRIGEQFTASVFVSETEIYRVIGTPDGDVVDVALSITR